MKISIIIPALNEEKSIGLVLKSIPKIYDKLIVVNNGCSDKTSEVAEKHGAIVIKEQRRGYGYACLKGIDFLEKFPPDILVLIDGDYSDYPEQINKIVNPILKNKSDFVVGSRVITLREKGSMTPQQVFGNKLACFLMNLLYKGTFTDLGPFRAIRWKTLKDLKMCDKTYGWTIEMQLKVLKNKISYCEVPVNYRKRIGYSKVSGTFKGTVFAGFKIISWIFKYYLRK